MCRDSCTSDSVTKVATLVKEEVLQLRYTLLVCASVETTSSSERSLTLRLYDSSPSEMEHDIMETRGMSI